MRGAWLAVVALATGCLQNESYRCDNDMQCRNPERSGRCILSLNWCAYEDGTCPSNWEYSEFAGDDFAGQCVAEDGGVVSSAGTEDTGDGMAASTDGAAACAEPCTTPPGDCWDASSGVCEEGECVFAPQVAGEPCVDDCEAGGACDASGTCICTPGGESSGGTIEDCEMTCMVGPNSTAAVCDDTGACVLACVDPWQDCDHDPVNGCEVPVGVPHQCDATGIVASGGCWTAYCGNSGAATATNFGAYYCTDCPTCEEPAAGQCHWCDHDTGTWFPQATCVCGSFLGAVCAP